jgi:LemA protein
MRRGQAIGLGCAGLVVLALVIAGLSLSSTYNGIVEREQDVNAKWAQVENVYQRRADLVPNLVATVKGYAAHEREVLETVTASRAQVGSIQVTPEILNQPAEFEKFQKAQASLTGALSRLLAVVERYPDLKANQNFLELQSQLEGTENRITVERMRFTQSAQAYNTYIKRFPTNLAARMFGFVEKQYFRGTEGSERPPVVDFSK